MGQPKQTSLKERIQNTSPFSGIAVPLLIVALAVLIIVGVTKMLSNDKSYVSLVEELRDKTFGNRWVAAFELSKYLASSQIPKEDYPWLEEQLIDLYKRNENDPRTRHFLVLAAGHIQGERSIELMHQALSDPDREVLFASLSSLGRLTTVPSNFNWADVIKLTSSDDEILVHTALVVLTHHRVTAVIPILKDKLKYSEAKNIKDVSAIALLHFNSYEGFDRLVEILRAPYITGQDSLKVEANKLNVIGAASAVVKTFGMLQPNLVVILQEVAKADQNVQVSLRAKELLLTLKK